MMEANKLPSIQSLLNSPRNPPTSYAAQSTPSRASSPGSSLPEYEVPTPSSSPRARKGRRPKKSTGSIEMTMAHPTGPIKYAPFENLDAQSLRQVQKFRVFPFGGIAEYCAQVPYSSDKRDVFEKTGRECLRVFKYSFTDPADGESYDVMWDYFGGFVRISPFFKCRKHKKTGPSKMLTMNPGMRDVTFHMTGGNRTAQGYWLPFSCAKAVCATFCHPIAGALIPIFGADFPRQCIPQGHPDHGRMVIDPAIIREAAHEVTASRHSSLPFSLVRQADVTSHPRPNTADSGFSNASAGPGSYPRIEDYCMWPRRPAAAEWDASTSSPSPEERYIDSAESSPNWSPSLYPLPLEEMPRPYYPSLTSALPIPSPSTSIAPIRTASYDLSTMGNVGAGAQPTSNPDWREGSSLYPRPALPPGAPIYGDSTYAEPRPTHRRADSDGDVFMDLQCHDTTSMFKLRPTHLAQREPGHLANRSEEEEMAQVLLSLNKN